MKRPSTLADSEPASGQSQDEHAYRTLRGEILHGELMPGERLRAADLHQRFELGLTPIREALMRLASENLVDTDTHRGFRVSQASAEAFADLMASRRDIEALCLTSSIEHGDAAWEAEIIASLHLLSRTATPASPDDRDAAALWEARHRDFHWALVAACRSDWLLRFWNTLTDHSERYRKIRLLHQPAGPRQRKPRNTQDEHQAIAAAVIERDVARAIGLMNHHLEATERSVLSLLQKQPEA